MKLTIVAATGGIGRHLLDQAGAAGHQVTAVVRNPDALSAPAVRVVSADLSSVDPATLESAIAGADAVLSGLGPRRKAEHGIVSAGTQRVIAAMESTGVRRLVVVSGAGVSTARTPARPDPPRREPGAGLRNQYLFTPLARTLLGAHFVDVARMEDLLRASTLDWTAVRAPLLTDRPPTGRYRTAPGRNVRGGFRASRADVADYMLRTLDLPETIKQAIGIAA